MSYRDYKEDKICELCERAVDILTQHHLIPKSKGGKYYGTILVCLSCKDTIHLIPNKDLAKYYNTLETLKAAPELTTYMKWIKKQKRDRVTIRTKKRRNSSWNV